MSKISPRVDDYREVQTGTDDGRRRENVFNPNLFTDNYADGLACKSKNKTVQRKKTREMSLLSTIQCGAMNDLVAKKVTAQKDRFDRVLDAKALAEVVETVSLPYTIAICAEGGHGKTFFLRLLKKCLDAGAAEDPDTLELFQHFEKKSREVNERNAFYQSQSEQLFEMEANETEEEYHCRDEYHGIKPPPTEHVVWYRLKTLLRPLGTCLYNIFCCLPLVFCDSTRRLRGTEVSYWPLVLRVLLFGMWHDVWQGLYVYMQSVRLGHDYQPLPKYLSKEDEDEGRDEEEGVGVEGVHNVKTFNREYSNDDNHHCQKSYDVHGADSVKRKEPWERVPNENTNENVNNKPHIKEFIFVDFNPAWETLDHITPVHGSVSTSNSSGDPLDMSHTLVLTLVAQVFRKVELRLQQQKPSSDASDDNIKHLFKRFHANYKSRLRLKHSLRILIEVYGNMFQIRSRVFLLILFLINLAFIFLVVVQHLVIQIFFQRYHIQNLVLKWLVPHTTWVFVINCLLLSVLVAGLLVVPVYRFMSLLIGTADHSYSGAVSLLEHLQQPLKHAEHNRKGLIPLIRRELHELFTFLKVDFSNKTGIELVVVVFIDDMDKLQHHHPYHSESTRTTNNGDILLQFFESLKYVLLTVEQAPVLFVLAMDLSLVASQLEACSTRAPFDLSSMASPTQTTSLRRGVPVWGYDYLDKHIVDLPFHLPELTKHKVQHYLSASILPSQDFLIQNALRSVYGLLEHLNSLDAVAIEFFDVEFLEDLSLLSEEQNQHESGINNCTVRESDALGTSVDGSSVKSRREGRDLQSPATEEGHSPPTDHHQLDGENLAKAVEKVEVLKEIRETDAREQFANFFNNPNAVPQYHSAPVHGGQDHINSTNNSKEMLCDASELSPPSGAEGKNSDQTGETCPSLNDFASPNKTLIKKKVFHAKTLRTELNRLNDSWKHSKTTGSGCDVSMGNMAGGSVGEQRQREIRTSGILSFLVNTGRLLTKEIAEAIDLYQADVPEGLELFCKALTSIMLNVRITFRFTALPSPSLRTPAPTVTQNKDREEVVADISWAIRPFREVKRVVVDAEALKHVVMKDANGNIIDMKSIHGKNFLEANNYGRIKELTPLQLKAIKSDVVKQVKRREIIKAKKVEIFRDDKDRIAFEKAAKIKARKAIKFILFIEWSSDGRFLMFACNDGVVGVVDFYTNTERVAGELFREVVLEGEEERGVRSNKQAQAAAPVNISITSMSMSPSTCYLAVGGADGKVAVYDSTRDWEQVHLLDISAHNETADAQAPQQVKVTALSWSPESTFLVIGDNRGNVFLVTTVGRIAMTHSVASSGRSSAIVEMQLPSDEPAAELAWRVVTAIFNREYTYQYDMDGDDGGGDETFKLVRRDSQKRKKKEKKKINKSAELKVDQSLLTVDSSDDEGGRYYTQQEDRRRESNIDNARPEDKDSDHEDGYCDFRFDPLEAVTCLCWSADMTYLVAGRRNQELTLYLREEKQFGARSVRLVGHTGAVTCLALAHSDTWLVSSGEDFQLRVWNMTSARMQCSNSTANEVNVASPSLCVSVLSGHSGRITGLSITPSDRFIISCSKDAKIILWNVATGENFCHYQEFPVMVMGLSADMQLLAHACNEDGTLRVARLESTAQACFIGANLHSLHETLDTPKPTMKRAYSNNASDTCHSFSALVSNHLNDPNIETNSNNLLDISFQRVDSDSLMAHITHPQLAVLTYLNSLLQPYLLLSNITKVKRIVQVVHLVNRWAANKRVRRGDVDSVVHLDPRWGIFSLKVAQWAYLCEYFPYRMSFLVHQYIEEVYKDNCRHDQNDLSNSAGNPTSVFDTNDVTTCNINVHNQGGGDFRASRLCDFFEQRVQPRLYSPRSAESLASLDAPSVLFRTLLAATPSTPLADKMFAATFQQQFRRSAAALPPSSISRADSNCNRPSDNINSGDGGTIDIIDLTNIIGRDVLGTARALGELSSSNTGEAKHDEDFHFSLLECTFNLDPHIRNIISLELAATADIKESHSD